MSPLAPLYKAIAASSKWKLSINQSINLYNANFIMILTEFADVSGRGVGVDIDVDIDVDVVKEFLLCSAGFIPFKRSGEVVLNVSVCRAGIM